MDRENQAGLKGTKLTRDERKALRKLDLLDCTPERRKELRAKAEGTIAYLTETRRKTEVSDEQNRRNCASHVLTLECLTEIGD